MADSPIGKIQKSWMLFSCPFQQFTTSVHNFGSINLVHIINASRPEALVTPNDLNIVNFPVPLTIFLSLSLLTLTFYINPLSDGFSSEFNFFAASWAEKCMTLEILVKAWLSVYRVGHFFHWERWTRDTGTSQSFEKKAIIRLWCNK